MTKWTKLIVSSEPFVQTVRVESVRALQTTHLCVFIELVKANGTLARVRLYYSSMDRYSQAYHRGSVARFEQAFFSSRDANQSSNC